MRARARRWTAYLLCIAIVGCTYLSFERRTQQHRAWSVQTGEDRVAFVRVEHDGDRDLLKLSVGDTVTKHLDHFVEREEDLELTSAYFSAFEATVVDDDDYSLALLVLPITLTIDLCGPLFSLFVTPIVALCTSTRGTWVDRTPGDAVADVLWSSFDLVDPAVPEARVTLTSAEAQALSVMELSLLGFRSSTLTAVSPEGVERAVALPATAVNVLTELNRLRDKVPAELVVRVATTEALSSVLVAARPGAWIQLEQGEYVVPESIFRFGGRFTLAGRGLGRTRLVCRGSRAFDLRGAYDVTFRGLSIALEGQATSSDGVAANGGVLRLERCAIWGAKTLKVSEAPDEHGRVASSFRGGVGVLLSGSGKTFLTACQISGAAAGALAGGTHELFVGGSTMSGGELEAVSYRDGSSGRVWRSTLTGQGHGVLVRDKAHAEVADNTIRVTQAGVFVATEARASVSGNTIEACTNGISIEGAANASVSGNTCRGNGAGVLVSSTGGDVNVTNNTCEGNSGNGISVQGEARPNLSNNTCRANKGAGILFSEKAGGVAVANTVARNASGVSCQGTSSPRVERNSCTDNSQGGILCSDQTTANVTGNTCTGNQIGLGVQGQARPNVVSNTLESNSTGLQLTDNGTGSFTGNTIRNNRGPGVYSSSYTQPVRFDANTIFGNNPDRAP
jgi:parallel beta-helix repeat protein